MPTHDELHEVVKGLDRMIGRDQAHQPIDQAHAHAQQRAHLIRRGRTVADGMGLGHVQDHSLAELGRLDIIGHAPTLDQDLAVALDQIVTEREELPEYATWAYQRELHKNCHHARNVTCNLDKRPRPGTTAPEPSGIGSAETNDQGQVATAAGGVGETREEIDRKRYWDRITRDHPDEERSGP
jgi:hypothetical protein